MLLDATHRRAAVLCAATTAVSGAYYVVYDARTLGGANGGTPSGLAFGGAAAAMVLFAGLLGARRRVSTWALGRASEWMRGHIWLGLLALPLALFHSGFRLGGTQSTATMVLLALVVATGLLGLALQQWLPRAMAGAVPLETVYEQIEHVEALLRAEADDLVAAVSGGPLFPEPEPAAAAAASPAGPGGAAPGAAKPAPRGKKRAPAPALEGSGRLKDFYLRELRPWLARAGGDDPRFSSARKRAALLERVRTLLPPPLHETLADLESICAERCQLDRQRRLHGYLHGWLLVHVPLAAALVALVALHAVVSLRY